MNPENGGQQTFGGQPAQQPVQPVQQPAQPSASDLQRQAAASLARQKVLASYSAAAQKSYQDHTDNASTMKEEKIDPTAKANQESWKKYHSAWQNYYQNYYSNYYQNAAKNYIAKERLRDEREKEEEKEIFVGKKSAEDRLRLFVRKKATDSAKKNRRHRKIIPILIGSGIVLVILFLQYNRLIFAPIIAYMTPGGNAASEIESIDPTVSNMISNEPKIIIPKINVNAPIVLNVPANDTLPAMEKGVAHFRVSGASAYPGEFGNFVLSGHSSNDIYSSNPYGFIFSGLERLVDNDLIYVNYEGVRYTYKVVKRQIVDPSNVAALRMGNDKPLITLITCTPVGLATNRLLVTGEQISPDYSDMLGNRDEDEDTYEDEGVEAMPSSEPTFFEGIWNWLTGK